MNHGYQIKFCKCGRIHHLINFVIDWLKEDIENREIIQICKNCGEAERIWLSEYEDGYAINVLGLSYAEPVQCRIYADNGFPVYMKSGKLADTLCGGFFYNAEEHLAEEKKSGYNGLLEAEKNREPWAMVDTQRLIDTVKKENIVCADDILKSISGYAMHIHWEDTPYCTAYNR